MAEIEARQQALANLTDHKERNLGKGKHRIDDREITSQQMVAKPKTSNRRTESSCSTKAKMNFTTTLDIIKGKIDKNQINKGNKHKLCECGELKLVEDSEEDSDEYSEEDEDSDEGKALVWPDWPEFGLGSSYYKMLEKHYLESKKEKEAFVKAKEEHEANGEAEPKVPLPWWYQRW